MYLSENSPEMNGDKPRKYTRGETAEIFRVPYEGVIKAISL